MSWKDDYQKALLNVMARKAYVCEDNPSFYGWADYDGTEIWRGHLKTCGIAPDCPMPEEEHWEEFEGTFADNRRVHGVHVVAACTCGSYRNVELYLEATFSELVSDVLAEPE